jgi:hypothetical protein
MIHRDDINCDDDAANDGAVHDGALSSPYNHVGCSKGCCKTPSLASLRLCQQQERQVRLITDSAKQLRQHQTALMNSSQYLRYKATFIFFNNSRKNLDILSHTDLWGGCHQTNMPPAPGPWLCSPSQQPASPSLQRPGVAPKKKIYQNVMRDLILPSNIFSEIFICIGI